MSTKRLILFLMASAILLTISLGCEKAGPNLEPTAAPPASKTEKPGGLVHAETLAAPGKISEDVDYMDVSEAFRQTLWSFAGKTSSAALTGPAASNSLYSPVSLYYGLAMLEAGAAGQTKAELRAFMAVHGDQAIGPELGKLYALMSIDREDSIEQIANALWARKDLVGGSGGGVKQAWLDQLSHDFYASAFAVDFTNPETAKEMSRWVEQETRGKIKPQIDVSDPGLLMVLMNTLYFKAGWIENFREDEVVKGDFFGHEGTLTDISYLRRDFISLPALKTDQFTAAALPLTNGRLDLILPAEGMSPEDLLGDPAFLAGLRSAAWRDYGVDLKLPKFEYKTKTDILKAMESLGLPAIVKGGPDFSAMIDRGAEVSTISQEAFIALDEKGVEAAAYTEIGIVESMPLAPDEHMDLHLDRSFLFVISDQAGAPLFVGIVRNPAQS
ncbi:MAG TPA: serpin family protein [Bacillota bacterium]|jgi:serine protease inhibitor|nr:serpin family protein [Fastidiosipila sp.]HPX92837.1 serpin family protein [Bacillota bacterium]HQB81322.1 serpin family protein [Bacillota bacterium]